MLPGACSAVKTSCTLHTPSCGFPSWHTDAPAPVCTHACAHLHTRGCMCVCHELCFECACARPCVHTCMCVHVHAHMCPSVQCVWLAAQWLCEGGLLWAATRATLGAARGQARGHIKPPEGWMASQGRRPPGRGWFSDPLPAPRSLGGPEEMQKETHQPGEGEGTRAATVWWPRCPPLGSRVPHAGTEGRTSRPPRLGPSAQVPIWGRG